MKHLLTLCSAFLLACGMTGLGLVKASAETDPETETVSVTAPASFTMGHGASVRLNDPTGIRFSATISAADYNTFIDTYGEDNVEFGMCIARTDSLDTLKANLSNDALYHEMTAWDLKENPEVETATTYRYNFAIYNLNTENYNKYYTALAYAKVIDRNETVYASVAEGVEVTRTPLQVAQMAILDGKTHKDLYTIVDTVMATSPVIELNQTSYTISDSTGIDLQTTVGGVPVDVLYTVGNDAVAKIEGGKLYGVSKGETTVTATINGANGATYTKQAAVTVTKEACAPTIQKGILTLGTNGEATTISIVDGNGATVASVQTSEATYDIDEMIQSYMQTNAITEETVYIVNVDSESYYGAVTSDKYQAISSWTLFVNKLMNPAAGKGAVAGKRFFFTANISGSDANAYAGKTMVGEEAWRAVSGECYNADIDGRGYKLTINMSYASSVAGSGYSGLAAIVKDAEWENLHVEMNVTVPNGNEYYNLFLGKTENFTLKNSYVAVNLTNTNTEKSVYPLFRPGTGTVVEDCIFELNSKTAGKSIVMGDTVTDYTVGGTFKNSVILNKTMATTVFGNVLNGVTVENVYQYETAGAFANNVDGKVQNNATLTDATTAITLGDAWTVTTENIKFFGKVVKNCQTEVTPTVVKGMLTLNTAGEATTISVLDGETEIASVTTEKGVTEYDIDEMIMDYIEAQVGNSATGNSYTVNVKSANYYGSVTSETYVSISSVDQFKYRMGLSGVRCFLMENISFPASGSAMANSYYPTGSNGERWRVTFETITVDLDGRNYTLKCVASTAVSEGFYSGIAGKIENSTWENLNIVIDHTIPTADNAGNTGTCYNLLAGIVSNFTMKNCNISVTLINNSTAGNFSLFRPTGNTVVENCVFNLVSKTEGTSIVVGDTVTGYTAGGTFKDCVFINSTTTSFGNVANSVTIENVYHYATTTDYENKTNGKVQNGSTIEDVTE